MTAEAAPFGAAIPTGAKGEGAAPQAGEAPPVLRRDLNIHPADPDPDGAPAWLLHDPAANRYFRIGAAAVDMLNLVTGRSAEQVARETRQRYGHDVAPDDAETLFTFLRSNYLVETDDAQLQRFRQHRLGRPNFLARAAKGYISFRIPLLHPDRFLAAALPCVRWLGAGPALACIALIGVLGLYFTSRQMDIFLATLVQFISFEGVLIYAAAIIFVKACHEFGHAFAAKAMGLRVPTIGIAFIVFWPVAYTDTTDAWRLTRRRDKLKIGAAGVGVELAIASISLFLWNVSPDGPLRDALFLLATSSWVISLLVNLNPLMRFDGYFLFSDFMRMPNMESRGHAMGKWRLRRLLFGLDDPRPETGNGWLAVYAYAVWIYRFFLFLGIALAVYFLFFKALGLMLFLVEIVYFIGAPIYRELRQWRSRFREFRANPAFYRTLGVLCAVTVLLAVPWRGSVNVPGLLTNDYQTVYAPEAARLEDLHVAPGRRVAAGEPLAELHSPDLEHELGQAVREYDQLRAERAALGVDSVLRERALVVGAELGSQRRLLEALRQRLTSLSVEAPEDGIVVDMSQVLSRGDWLVEGEPLFAVLGDGGTQRIIAYVGEADIRRLSPGSRAQFVAESGVWESIEARVVEISQQGLRRIDKPLITSSHGGGVEVRVNDSKEAIPLRAVYEVTLEPIEPARATAPRRELRGRVRIDAAPESLLQGIWARTVALLRRESGF